MEEKQQPQIKNKIVEMLGVGSDNPQPQQNNTNNTNNIELTSDELNEIMDEQYTEETLAYIEQIQNENKLILDYLNQQEVGGKLSTIERMLLEELQQLNMELIDIQKKMDGYNKPAPRIIQVKRDLIETKTKILKQLADLHLTKMKLDIEGGNNANTLIKILNDENILRLGVNPQPQQNTTNNQKPVKHKIELTNEFLDNPLFDE